MQYHKEKYPIECKICKIIFYVWYSRRNIAKYCSIEHQIIGQRYNMGPNRGKKFSKDHREKISLGAKKRFQTEVVWNKGLTKTDSRIARGTEKISNENHYLWKGDAVSYISLHQWVRRKLGKPQKCLHCGEENKRIEWASKSHKAKRDLRDYIPLCNKCHLAYDNIIERAWKTKKNIQ